MAQILKTTIKLRRDTVSNYASYENHIPLQGEVCIVDPTAASRWAKTKNIRFKVGDGVTAWKDLPYYDEQNSSVLCGFYADGKFYLDAAHTQEVEELMSTMIYVDKHSGALYYYDGIELHVSTMPLPTASDEIPGIMKLYQTLGQNTDGTMSQKAITDGFTSIGLVVDEQDSEAFCLVAPTM